MKTLILNILLVCVLGVKSLSAQGFYYENISTPDKSIDFLFGFYVSTINFNERKDGSGYSTVQIALINKSEKDFKWNDYKVYVLLKNGDLFYNYKTEAKEGDYACIFDLGAGKTEKKFICFEKKFKKEDIEKVWLSFNDYKFFKLLYSDQ